MHRAAVAEATARAACLRRRLNARRNVADFFQFYRSIARGWLSEAAAGRKLFSVGFAGEAVVLIAANAATDVTALAVGAGHSAPLAARSCASSSGVLPLRSALGMCTR